MPSEVIATSPAHSDEVGRGFRAEAAACFLDGCALTIEVARLHSCGQPPAGAAAGFLLCFKKWTLSADWPSAAPSRIGAAATVQL